MSIYRLSIDFPSAELMIQWYTQQQENALPGHHPNETDQLVLWDSLHDKDKSIKRFLLRRHDERGGNGRPVQVVTQPSTKTLEKKELSHYE